MGAWHFLVLSAGKPPHAHKIPPFRGGGVVGVSKNLVRGGRKCQLYFYGRRDFYLSTKEWKIRDEVLRANLRIDSCESGHLSLGISDPIS